MVRSSDATGGHGHAASDVDPEGKGAAWVGGNRSSDGRIGAADVERREGVELGGEGIAEG